MPNIHSSGKTVIFLLCKSLAYYSISYLSRREKFHNISSK